MFPVPPQLYLCLVHAARNSLKLYSKGEKMSDYDDLEELEEENDLNLFEIVRVKHLEVALPAAFIEEALLMPDLTALPESPPSLRGAANIRGDVIPVFDMRILLGLKSSSEENSELVELLRLREQDHLKWIAELEASVRENREFTLARDPTKCAFGKWYYSFDPSQFHLNSVSARSLIKSLAEPHARIHAFADTVLARAAVPDIPGALAMVEEARQTVLAELIELFGEFRSNLRNLRRELVLIIDVGGCRVGVSVDSAESIEQIDDASDNGPVSLFEGNQPKLVRGIGHRKNGELVLMLDWDKFASAVAPLALSL